MIVEHSRSWSSHGQGINNPSCNQVKPRLGNIGRHHNWCLWVTGQTISVRQLALPRPVCAVDCLPLQCHYSALTHPPTYSAPTDWHKETLSTVFVGIYSQERTEQSKKRRKARALLHVRSSYLRSLLRIHTKVTQETTRIADKQK